MTKEVGYGTALEVLQDTIGQLLADFEQKHNVAIDAINIAEHDITTLSDPGPRIIREIILEIRSKDHSWGAAMRQGGRPFMQDDAEDEDDTL